MLVIFDLDDTLVETSKCLTPHYLRLAFTAMQKEGLALEEEAFSHLLSLNAKALSSRVALQEFCTHFSSQKEIYQAGLSAFATELPQFLVIEPVPGAIELLDFLQKGHTLALVTAGYPELQLQKLKKAGIQPERFSKLVVGKGPSKKLDYQTVLRETGTLPSEALVCGDRVVVDLSPAKELGLFTVHFRNGRGKVHCEPQKDVDLTINTLKELHEVFANHEN